jgi:hypothetical protein
MNNLISYNDIYNFFCNYTINSNYLAFLRIITCGYIISFYLFLIKDCFAFIDPNGIFSYSDYKKFSTYQFPQISLYNIIGNSKIFSYGILYAFFLSGILSTIGLLTTFSLWIFLICMISIQNRVTVLVLSGGDIIGRLLILALCLIDSGSKFSVDNILGISTDLNKVDGWTIRLVQITVVFGYFVSSLRKLNDYYWLSGQAIRNAISSHLWGQKIKLRLFTNKFLCTAVNYCVLLFQLMSPVIFLIKETNFLVILFGIVLHASIIIFLRIGFFGPIMLISIMYFCNEYFNSLTSMLNRILL